MELENSTRKEIEQATHSSQLKVEQKTVTAKDTATADVAFFTTGLATLGRAAGFVGSLSQKLNRDDSGAVSLTPPA